MAPAAKLSGWLLEVQVSHIEKEALSPEWPPSRRRMSLPDLALALLPNLPLRAENVQAV